VNISNKLQVAIMFTLISNRYRREGPMCPSDKNNKIPKRNDTQGVPYDLLFKLHHKSNKPQILFIICSFIRNDNYTYQYLSHTETILKHYMNFHFLYNRKLREIVRNFALCKKAFIFAPKIGG